ncbi:MAG TPA: NUDIX hydrolase [Candidatus Saccharimonadales bacterium]|nr:NUDIX hydrolase [Candidatus Saccharimonadales bacterium]
MTEMVDLVDAEGNVVERDVPRDDAAHHEGRYMQIVIVVVRNSAGQVLVHERSAQKRVNPGDVDLVCGGMVAGETPMDAAVREAQEETGLTPKGLRIVRQGLNSYKRYCHLLVGESDEVPGTHLDPTEVAWAGWRSPAELKAAQQHRELTFVDGFFEDLDLALQAAGK